MASQVSDCLSSQLQNQLNVFIGVRNVLGIASNNYQTLSGIVHCSVRCGSDADEAQPVRRYCRWRHFQYLVAIKPEVSQWKSLVQWTSDNWRQASGAQGHKATRGSAFFWFQKSVSLIIWGNMMSLTTCQINFPLADTTLKNCLKNHSLLTFNDQYYKHDYSIRDNFF